MSKQYPGGLITKTPVVPNSISAPGIWSLSDQAKAQASNTWPFTRDPQFNYVTMLLHGDGSAGVPSTGSGAGASTTVTNFNADASTNNFNVAINGDARSNNFTPYQSNGYYSNYFDGTGDYLTVPDNAVFSLGSGNFTIEAWVYPTASPAQPMIIGQWTSSYAWTMQLSNDGNRYLRALLHDGSFQDYVSTSALQLGVWNHCAFVRESNTVSLYLNGTRVYTTSFSGTVTNSTSAVSIGADASGGQPLEGYVSNARVVVGTALYSGATYTVPTAPLTAVSGTSLLTCQSNSFIDNSSTASVVTSFGNAAVAPAQPFTLPTTSATYGSGYFASGNWLDASANSAFSFTGSFTVECWVYQTSRGNNGVVTEIGLYTDGVMIRLGTVGGIYDAVYVNNTNIGGISTYVPLNSWTYIAVVRNGTSVTVYVNGVSRATGTVSGTVNGAVGGTRIGAPLHTVGTDQPFSGYITDFRIVKGTAVYTTTFTPPTSPLTAISGTSLLTTQYNGGGNNSGFKDSSQNNFVITRNGNTTQGAFGPFGADWSNSFNGSTAYLNLASNGNLDFGTGDFTIECWINFADNTNYYTAIGTGNYTTSSTNMYVLRQNNSGAIQFFYGNGANQNFLTGTTTIVANTWNHIAVSRSGTTMRIFLNGVLENTVTSSMNFTSPYGTYIGADNEGTYGIVSFAKGYISNVRIVKGTAVYTATFTPSTTPLTAISGTSLLTCQSNRFVDNSTNAFAITVNGNPSVQGFSPFAPLTVYNPATYGGSGYFDGTGDYLTCSASVPATGAFTVEMWVYPTSTAGYQLLLSQFTSGNAGNFQILWDDTTDKFTVNIGASTVLTSSTTYPLNAWHHLAVTRNSSNSMTMWVNGASAATATNSTSILQTTTYISSRSALDGYFNGYLSNIRVTNTAVYTGAFTPPTAPLTAITGTSLLLSTTNAGVFDNAMINNLESVGNATISTNVVKYGRASMLFDGTGDYLKMPATNLNVGFNTSDFTVELWIYFNSVSGVQKIYDNYNGNNNANAALVLNNPTAGKMQWYSGQTQVLQTTTTFTTGAWYHVAVSRSSGTSKIFVNGTQEASATDSNNYVVGNANVAIGAEISTALYSVNGYIDDFRITYGYARYTASFTAPTSAFPNG